MSTAVVQRAIVHGSIVAVAANFKQAAGRQSVVGCQAFHSTLWTCTCCSELHALGRALSNCILAAYVQWLSLLLAKLLRTNRMCSPAAWECICGRG